MRIEYLNLISMYVQNNHIEGGRIGGDALVFQDRDRACRSNESNKSVLKASQTHHY